MRSCPVLLAVCLLLPVCVFGWQNSWDKKHTAECRDGQYVTRVRSYHSNSKEDRRWQVTCGKQQGLSATDNCKWTGYVNNWDDVLTFTCPANQVMTGMSSDHNNGKEDRRFRFRCCGIEFERKVCQDGRFGSECQFKCQCAGNQVCDKVNGTCPSSCREGKYGAACQLDNNCYYSDNMADYQGSKATTETGKTCQQWALDTPHQHRYHDKCTFKDGGSPENFCRTAVTESDHSPWCYTTDPDTRWESCGLKSCDCPKGRYGSDCQLECHCGGSQSCDRQTGQCPSGACALGWGGEGCQVKLAATLTGCYVTGYANNWDKEMDWRVPAGSVVTGAFSHHSNSKEDRRWKFVVCKF